jgi:propanol-preferring alcohol dehydrogenase
MIFNFEYVSVEAYIVSMKAIRLNRPGSVETNPLKVVDIAIPRVAGTQILMHVRACGLCHTDLHIVEGELPVQRSPLVPGHQIVGIVEAVGPDVGSHRPGDRVGVPWLNAVCGKCRFCVSGRENLCVNARFTGYHVDGGYADYVIIDESAAYSIPTLFSDEGAAPLLCAGVIGFRAVRLSDIKPGGRVGLYGFGASAHIAIQILRHWGCEVYVFTRSHHHRDLATELGAAWTGSAEEHPPDPIDSAIIFAPAGQLVVSALKVLDKGGTVALAGIHMSTIPAFEYDVLYHERTIRSVANSTRQDVRDLLELAGKIPLHTEVETFPLADANRALQRLKKSEIRASGVLVVDW